MHARHYMLQRPAAATVCHCSERSAPEFAFAPRPMQRQARSVLPSSPRTPICAACIALCSHRSLRLAPRQRKAISRLRYSSSTLRSAQVPRYTCSHQQNIAPHSRSAIATHDAQRASIQLSTYAADHHQKTHRTGVQTPQKQRATAITQPQVKQATAVELVHLGT